MEKALAVANAFIERGVAHKNPPTQMKLQKLMYFAHGWHLALYDTPLVDQPFYAWQYGPVIPSVYHEFKMFGTLGIDRMGLEYVGTEKGVLWFSPQIEPEKAIENALIDRIWEVYGIYSGTQLSKITHLDDSPWKKVRDENLGVRDIIIPDDLIRDYFKEIRRQHHAQ
ncbi:MAG: SocA family protein [Desulfovibrionaceae bacterium]|nr:SocA family protein [Desulfovibrionaceae bacterium]